MNECKLITFDDIEINEIELANRIKMPAGTDFESLQRCICEVKKSAKPMFCCRKADIKVDEDTVDFGFCRVTSKNLAKNLHGLSSAFVMASTLGIDLDRLITRLSVTNKAYGFLSDAAASAMAESLMDYGNNLLMEDYKLRPRFSAGYGDFDLCCQADLLDFVNADKLLGIKLGDNLMMTPRKSITAVCGIESVIDK
jgi:hypothetical protein